ncbi:MAG: fumarate hydratase [Acidaminobacter sp.]|uniref:fumarate hydratase n=1 Tax=Acidaminobacter sp. TaxID=1872102 RepID=UPI001381AC65|nr:fumarate hydratase [Acidaminobacter sp.]MZQ98391.1 fumarate hydratase [Acidaminobacter sp.]
MKRVMHTSEVIPVISQLVMKACYELNDNVMDAFREAYKKEKSIYSKETLDLLIKNAEYAKKEQIACCHDTGTCVVIMEIGQEVSWEGPSLIDQINEGVRKGYKEGYLRNSIVRDPLDRVNTNDNTPAVIHTEIVEGDQVSITVMPKGGGSENMGSFTTLVPSEGIEGVKKFVLETIMQAGGKTCPPIIVGVGVGGTMDKAAWIAKKALLRPIGERNSKPLYATLEEELLEAINDTGIGTLGMGGTVTALDVHIDYYPCHITALPVAVNLQCHASRHASAVI